MKKIFFVISLLFVLSTSSQVITDSIKATTEIAKIETTKVFPCDVNRIAMKFEIDTLSTGVKIALNDAQLLYKSNEIKQPDLRMPTQYNLEEKEITDGLRINLKQIKIGSLLLTNVDAQVVKDQEIALVIGKSIISKTGKIAIINNDFVFSNITANPILPVKIDLTNDEFSVNNRTIVVELANKELRNNLVSNLRRYVRSNEKEDEKELRVSLTFKIDLYTDNKNDEKYNEELEINQKTVAGKMMYDTFKFINTSEDTKSILEYYNETSFNLIFIYKDKTVKVKHSISRQNLKNLPIPFTKEQFLEALTVTKKK
jgi:hypothetical protein